MQKATPQNLQNALGLQQECSSGQHDLALVIFPLAGGAGVTERAMGGRFRTPDPASGPASRFASAARQSSGQHQAASGLRV